MQSEPLFCCHSLTGGSSKNVLKPPISQNKTKSLFSKAYRLANIVSNKALHSFKLALFLWFCHSSSEEFCTQLPCHGFWTFTILWKKNIVQVNFMTNSIKHYSCSGWIFSFHYTSIVLPLSGWGNQPKTGLKEPYLGISRWILNLIA